MERPDWSHYIRARRPEHRVPAGACCRPVRGARHLGHCGRQRWIDGTEDAAGALIAPDTLRRAAGKRLHARGLLAAHDSYTFFDRLGDLVRTGPTLTNVNDIRAVLITGDEPEMR